jgi:hypothetical protein
MKDTLRKAVFGNTAVKIAGKVSHDDARALASEMECAPDAIRGLQKTSSHTSFVLAATGTRPFTVNIAFGALDTQPQMSEADHRAFRKMNRERLTATVKRNENNAEREVTAQQPAAPRGTNTAPNEYDTDV